MYRGIILHRCARTHATTLTWLAYYDFTCVYVANFVEIAAYIRAQRFEKRFLSITAIHFVYTNTATATRTYPERYRKYTELRNLSHVIVKLAVSVAGL